MKLIFQTLLLLCLTIQAKAQSKNTGTVVFNVKTIGTNIPDSIIFAFYPENNPYGVLSRYSAQLSEGRSRLVVPKINNPSKFILGAYINGKSRILGEYYAEPNDTLDLSIEMDGLKSEIQSIIAFYLDQVSNPPTEIANPRTVQTTFLLRVVERERFRHKSVRGRSHSRIPFVRERDRATKTGTV
ncbi:MAG: hypothetical protein EOO88_31465 [Pedobacter sp.]|nr:MAG: hypothetical protein EOO88_31465 [Pedobacter sp.]